MDRYEMANEALKQGYIYDLYGNKYTVVDIKDTDIEVFDSKTGHVILFTISTGTWFLEDPSEYIVTDSIEHNLLKRLYEIDIKYIIVIDRVGYVFNKDDKKFRKYCFISVNKNGIYKIEKEDDYVITLELLGEL